MKKIGLQELFIEELGKAYTAEQRIVDALPKLIKSASDAELKEALTHHLRETENQVTRLDNIFSLLNITPEEWACDGIEGLLQEGERTIKNKSKSPALDAAIILSAQKVEHYEICMYGTLISFAKQLDYESEIVDLLKESIKEEEAADKKLTKIAEGTFFTSGVNKEACDMDMSSGARHKK